MGYGQQASGTITIVPPLTAAELRRHPEFNEDPDRHRSLRRQEVILVIQREFTPTELGEICVISASELALVSPEEPFSRYNLVDQMQEIVTAYPNHAWAGHIILTGEDGDQTALIVEGRTVKEISPKIVWPWS